MRETSDRAAYVYGFMAVALWSTVSTAFKVSLRYQEPAVMLLYSALTSTLLLVAVLAFQGKWRLLGKQSAGDLFRSAILGLLNPFAYYLVLFKAYDLLLAQEAQVLNYTWGVVMVLLSIPLLRKKTTVMEILGALLSFSGVFVIAVKGNFASMSFTNLTGVLLAVGSSLLWALYWIFNLRDHRDEVLKLFLNFAFGTVFILVYLFVTGSLDVPGLKGLTGDVYIGLFEMGLTFIVWMKALSIAKHTARIANLVYVTPFISLIVINIVLGEAIHRSTIAGLLLIVGGILSQRIRMKKAKPEHVRAD